MKKRFLMGVLAFALIFTMALAGCAEAGDDNGEENPGEGGVAAPPGNDPITVDLSVPAVEDLPAFEGAFVASEAEADEILRRVLDYEIPSVWDLTWSKYPDVFDSSSGEVIFENDTFPEYPGAVATGFFQFDFKTNIADEFLEEFYEDDMSSLKIGDYYEEYYYEKLAVKLDSYEVYSMFVTGQSSAMGYVFDRLDMISDNPILEKYTYKDKGTAKYSLSVSANGKGLKFVMTENSVDDNEGVLNEEGDFFEETYKDNGSFKVTIDIYDNDNVKQYSKVFTDEDDWEEYLYGY
jgi:hypothetical protein